MEPRPSTNATRRAQQATAVAVATRKLLAEGHHFTDLSVATIAEEAGISRSAFYLHYPDKTALVLRLADEVRRDNLAAMSERTADGATGVDALIATYAQAIANARAASDIVAAVNDAVASDPAVKDYLNSELSGFSSAIQSDLTDGQEAGRVSADLDAEMAATIIVWGGDLVIRNHVAYGSPDRDAVLARELGLCHWYGFFQRPEADAAE